MPSVEGGCLCSAIRYRLNGAPRYSVICHCRSCRKASGAPSLAWLTFPLASLAWLRSVPRGLRSSPGVLRTFCGECGSPLTYANERAPEYIDVTTATLDDPSRFPPTAEVWLEHRVPWTVSNEALERYPRGSVE